MYVSSMLTSPYEQVIWTPLTVNGEKTAPEDTILRQFHHIARKMRKNRLDQARNICLFPYSIESRQIFPMEASASQMPEVNGDKFHSVTHFPIFKIRICNKKSVSPNAYIGDKDRRVIGAKPSFCWCPFVTHYSLDRKLSKVV